MKKEILANMDTMLAASLPTVLFAAVFVLAIVIVWRQDRSSLTDLAHMPLANDANDTDKGNEYVAK